MEEQSGREFASADPTAGAQDATLQERGLSPEVPLNARRLLQHFQRPTPSHVSSISSRATRRRDDNLARGRYGGLKMRRRRPLAVFAWQRDNANLRAAYGKQITPSASQQQRQKI